MKKRAQQLRRTLQEITTLEINTILCDGITGEQMTDPRHALFDVGSEYAAVLERLGSSPLPAALCTTEEDSTGHPQQKPFYGGRGAFEHFHRQARALFAAASPQSPEDRALLARIMGQSGQVVALFDRLRTQTRDPAGDQIDNHLTRAQINGSAGPALGSSPPPLPVDGDDIVFLRKIWEFGTACVALQSVITLDGDVVSRIAREYAGDDHAWLHRLHREGVEVAVSGWRALIDTIASFLAALVRR